MASIPATSKFGARGARTRCARSRGLFVCGLVIVVLILASGLLFAPGGMSHAQESQPPPRIVRGEIVSVDGQNLTVQTATGEETLALANDVRIVAGKRLLVAAQLRPGQRVICEVADTAQDATARLILVLGAAPEGERGVTIQGIAQEAEGGEPINLSNSDSDSTDPAVTVGADGRDHLLLTTQTFTDTRFILESRFQGVLTGWPLAFDHAYFLFGADESGQGGYRIVYAPLQGQVLLYRDDVLLDSAPIIPQLGLWYQVKVMRDGVGGGIAVYLDEGEGYPAQPLLQATDTTYPTLGRFGVGGNAQGFELYDDWVTVMPWEGE